MRPVHLALVVAVPLLTWIGYLMAVLGCMAATVAFTEMTPTIFLQGTAESLTLAHFASGIIKTPFLALAIALIACQQGLATRGGAAAVGARTTMAVVAAMLAVILISTVFTVVTTVMGI